VLLDGKRGLELAGGSALSLVYSLPASIPPGRHFLSGDPDLGYSDGILALQAIKLDTSVERATDPPQVRIKVRGTDRPVRLRVFNLDPFAASLGGGESQIVETDGGIENVAAVELRPSQFPSPAAQDLNIAFTLAEERSGCALRGPSPEQGLSPASAPGPRVAN
jgi:hypothetical protein